MIGLKLNQHHHDCLKAVYFGFSKGTVVILTALSASRARQEEFLEPHSFIDLKIWVRIGNWFSHLKNEDYRCRVQPLLFRLPMYRHDDVFSF